MQPYNTTLSQVLKWQYNNAPHLQALLQAKQDWLNKNVWNTWEKWESDVFDLRTASRFGCFIWVLILGIPSDIFFLGDSLDYAFAFGQKRQNFKYIVVDSADEDSTKNLIGGNFEGGGTLEVIPLTEIRKLLRTRYVALTSNGNVSYINRMLRIIWNDNQPWNVEQGNYFYLTTSETLATPAPANTMAYVMGENFAISANGFSLLADRTRGFN